MSAFQETAEEHMSESMQEFYTILDELVGDQSVDQVRLEFEKLIQALKKSRENEKRLMSKCRELNAEIVSSSTKVSAALQLSQDDQTTITSLKRELDKAWKMVDAANDKEKRDKEAIKNLKDEIAKLMEQAKQSDPSAEQEQIDLLNPIEALTKERDQLLTTAEDLREKLKETISKQQEIDVQRDAALENIAQLQQQLQEQQNEISRETRLKEKLDKEVKKLHEDMEAKAGDIRALTVQLQRATEEQQRLEQQLKELKLLNERCSRELEQMQQKNSKLQQDCEQVSADKERLSLDNLQNTNELKRREEEMTQMRQKISKQAKMREVLQKKLHQLEEQKADVEVERDTLKVQIPALEKESCHKQVETDKKAIDELIRERDNLNKNLVKSTQSTERQQNLVKLLEQDKKTLEHEITGHRQEAQRQQKTIQQLEKERDRYINETNIEVREKELFDWRKTVSEVECKLTQQENLLECTVKERNLYSRNLIEAQIAEIKRKMKTMNNQVTRLRDEISGKELALAKDEQERKRLDKDNEALKGELQQMKLQLEETKQHVDGQKAEQQNLQKIIADADAQHVQQKKQMEQVGRERDNLAKQLLHRNEERKLLYEKIKIQLSILSKGDFHYKERMEDIHLLKLEVKRLQRKKSILDKTVPNTEDLRRELFHLQRELLRERTRNSVLLEQRKPVNIHRWRCLEGSDPGKYELIMKIQSLQKRLIAKSQELEERELLLQEKEKLYVELKQILARQPGPEAAEQLQQHKWLLRDKASKLKALTAQVRVLDRRMSEYRCENQRLADELTNVKKKYLSQKKLHSQNRSSTRPQMDQLEALPPLNNRSNFTGGGFRVENPMRR
uniref:Cilia and flagella associated protein 58 n=1 Tax=Takifugu rubripes TaxID=31033 RepID=A0A674NJS0_TAKRU